MKHALALLVTCLMLTFAVPAADTGTLAGGPLAGRLLETLLDLDLSPEQITQVASVVKTNRPELKKLLDQVVADRLAVHHAIFAETLDEAAIRAAVQKAAISEEALAVARARVLQDLRPILSADQQAKLKALRLDLVAAITDRVTTVTGLVGKWADRHAN